MKPLSGQQGVALLLSLVILLVLSLLAISSMQGSVMQERMATAQRDGVVSLETAEAGLRQAEQVLEDLTNLDNFGTAAGFFETADEDLPNPYSPAIWTDNTMTIAGTEIDGRVPRFFFEYKGKVSLQPESDDNLPRDLGAPARSGPVELDSARIVVMAPGPSGESRRIIESFYVFDPDI